jgi:membrane associated rhomboid family serine protease
VAGPVEGDHPVDRGLPALPLGRWRPGLQVQAGEEVDRDPVTTIDCCQVHWAGVGTLAERVFGHGWWLLLYLGCGAVGQAFGYRWAPPDAGASVAGAGLLGAVCAWLLSPAGPRQAQVRVWGAIWPLAGIALTAMGDMHGPPLLVGFGLGALLLWRDRLRSR